jgi:hypothetical protein
MTAAAEGIALVGLVPCIPEVAAAPSMLLLDV